MAELMREQALTERAKRFRTRSRSQVEEIEQRRRADGDKATLWVETESQKGILIGSNGAMIKGSARGAQGARAMLETHVTWT